MNIKTKWLTPEDLAQQIRELIPESQGCSDARFEADALADHVLSMLKDPYQAGVAAERERLTSKSPWSFAGVRNFHPDHWSKVGFTMYAVQVPHQNGPWEAVFANTEELAMQIVALASERQLAKRVAQAIKDLQAVRSQGADHLLEAAYKQIDAALADWEKGSQG